MQDEFDDWGDFSDSDSRRGNSNSGNSRMTPGGGGWHWLLTLTALLIVGLLSMGCAWLTRNVEERPVWMMGLIFMVPAAAMMFAAMLVEEATSAMTPATSRKPQLILVITATVMTFVVACICDLIYLSAFIKPLPAAQSAPAPYEVSDRILLVMDPTKSMEQNGAQEQAENAVSMLLEQADPSWEVGMISGDQSVPAAPLTEDQKQKLLRLASASPEAGQLYYEEAVSSVLEEAETAPDGQRTRMILLTDGLHTWSRREGTDLTLRCLQADLTVYCVLAGEQAESTLAKLVSATGGSVLSPEKAAEALTGVQTTRRQDTIQPAPVEEKLKLDLLRNREPAAIVISGIMLFLEGLSLGVCLSLMLSVHGQFRFQYILSPLMGILAFALLKFIWDNHDITTTWWIKEGVSFSLLGIVVMLRNRRPGAKARAKAAAKNYEPDFDAGSDF